MDKGRWNENTTDDRYFFEICRDCFFSFSFMFIFQCAASRPAPLPQLCLQLCLQGQLQLDGVNLHGLHLQLYRGGVRRNP